MATPIDDNAADEKSDKSIGRLLNIHCISLYEKKKVVNVWENWEEGAQNLKEK